MSRAAKETSSPGASGCRRRTRGQKGGPAKIKIDDIAALKAHGVGQCSTATEAKPSYSSTRVPPCGDQPPGTVEGDET